MLIIQPQKQFLLNIKLNNPSDTSTYYVKAVVVDAISGATLLSQNLTDNGNQYFSYQWTVPSDPSGTGRQIVITTTVYTDSGYTAISPIYGATVDNHIIRNIAGGTNFGGFASRGLESTDVEKVVRKLLIELIPAPVEIEPYDDSYLRSSLKELRTLISELDISKGTALSQVESWLADRIKENHDLLHATFTGKISDFRKEIATLFTNMESSSNNRHETNQKSGKDILSRLEQWASDDSLGKKIDGLALEEKHKELLEKIESPVLLKFPAEHINREEKPKDARKITIENLLRLSS